jgi:protein ImuB
LDNATVALLAQLGVAQIGQLQQLPRASLAARFGPQLLLRLDQALGSVEETVTPFRPLPRFEAAWRLEYPTDQLEVLGHVLQRLLERVTAALMQQNVGAIQLECCLVCVTAAVVPLRIGLFRPVASPKYLWDLLRVSLERTQLPAVVERAAIHAALTAPLEQRQQTLFADADEKNEHELATLIDRLSLRLGPQAVVQPELVADAVPERAFRYVPLAGRLPSLAGESRRAARKKTTWSAAERLETLQQRPLVLLDSPQRLSVVAVAPDGPPSSFSYRRRQHTIVQHWGPERIEFGWWRGPTVRRDYYRVETSAGLQFWLFRKIPSGQWWMQGVFE